MATFDKLRRSASKTGRPTSVDDSCARLSQDVPDSFTLSEIGRLSDHLAESRKVPQDLLVLLACLLQSSRLRTEPTDSESLQEAAIAVTRSIAPIASADGSDEGAEESSGARDEDPYDRISSHCRDVAELGLRVVQQLLRLPVAAEVIVDHQILVTLAAFTDRDEAWASDETTSVATAILDSQLVDRDEHAFIAETILQEYLRPLFSKSRPPTVTASGRKAEYQDPDVERERALALETRETKPWKYADLRAIPAFAWALQHADESLITKSWPLFIPVLLTLIDDPLTRIRARGLRLTSTFLSKLPSATLRATGLAPVFEQAILPTLTYLPELTPELESVALLDPALDALRVLAGRAGEEGKAIRDRMLREGVFTAYFHASQHPRIVEVLCRQAGEVVAEAGVRAVKHLKDLIPMLAAVMTDPFALSHVPALLAAIAALQVVVANCWPRLAEGVWQDEIIKALSLCWVQTKDSSGSGRSQDGRMVEQELIKTAKMLAAVASNGGGDLGQKVSPLLLKEPNLSLLFAK